jgi:hypothetical protein
MPISKTLPTTTLRLLKVFLDFSDLGLFDRCYLVRLYHTVRYDRQKSSVRRSEGNNVF